MLTDKEDDALLEALDMLARRSTALNSDRSNADRWGLSDEGRKAIADAADLCRERHAAIERLRDRLGKAGRIAA